MYTRMNALEWIFFVLTVVGSLNWGLIGLFDFNLVAELFSSDNLQRIIYSLVGIATVGLVISVASKYDKVADRN